MFPHRSNAERCRAVVSCISGKHLRFGVKDAGRQASCLHPLLTSLAAWGRARKHPNAEVARDASASSGGATAAENLVIRSSQASTAYSETCIRGYAVVLVIIQDSIHKDKDKSAKNVSWFSSRRNVPQAILNSNGFWESATLTGIVPVVLIQCAIAHHVGCKKANVMYEHVHRRLGSHVYVPIFTPWSKQNGRASAPPGTAACHDATLVVRTSAYARQSFGTPG